LIAADTSTWIAFIQGDQGGDVQLLDSALQDRQLLMPPVTLAELFSDSNLPKSIAASLRDIPMVEIADGYWERAGALRAKVLGKGRKARLGDALIAQSCLDRGISLISRDRDFRAFADAAGLDLAIR
jgi:predicted nucleic acid-binding protein